jgi:AraC-like DNA-binding protein
MASPAIELFNHAVRTEDVDEARLFISDHIAPVRLGKEATASAIRFDARYFVDEDFLACDTFLSAGLTIVPDCELDAVMIRLGIAGVLRAEGHNADQLSGIGDILIHAARADKRLRYESERHEIVLILATSLVRDRMQDYLGYKAHLPFDFLMPVDATSAVGRSLFAFGVAIREGVAGSAPLLRSPIGLRRHKELLANLMLCALAPAQLEHLATPVAASSGADVARAEDFIRAHAGAAIAISDVAAHLGVSVRALQYAFRRHRDTTPLAVLQQARLEGTRRDLSSGLAETVAEVALRWGFTHFGRFSRQYQAAFGEKPSQTLARSRS